MQLIRAQIFGVNGGTRELVAAGELPLGAALEFFGRYRSLPNRKEVTRDDDHVTVSLPGLLPTLPEGMEWRHNQPTSFRLYEYRLDWPPTDESQPDRIEPGVWAFKLVHGPRPQGHELDALVKAMATAAGIEDDPQVEVTPVADDATTVLVTAWKPM